LLNVMIPVIRLMLGLALGSRQNQEIKRKEEAGEVVGDGFSVNLT